MEKVLVSPANRLSRYFPMFKDGIITDPFVVDDFTRESLSSNCFFMHRERAETDPTYKQIIPYCLIVKFERDENGNWTKQFLTYERGKKGEESRLHSKLSIGIGGHINPCDGSDDFDERFLGMYQAGLRRELQEEVGLGRLMAPAKAIIYDPSNAVGDVHIGVVHVVRLVDGDEPIQARDDSLVNLHWRTAKELRRDIDKLENWSKIIVSNRAFPSIFS